ncbi:hypothetical protein DFO66_103389 [Brevibacterium sanguinis]|uniref:Uncharacterized protein n=2 Tax=Brevibacterium TaxID=1696 RepID=A0A366IMJ6_9MICO|nr:MULTISPECIES: hypothetical protein [Brevibacterium]RBP66439.1 hypothetical protein DFO66_103389 [Brevibacterium sanguinis]RBP73091.1 hypothetical protein DFO65_103389 [Brevibacterium celere]
MAKNDSVQIDFSLDKLDLPEEARPYRFPFRGKNFETVDLAELSFDAMEKAMTAYHQTDSPRPVIDLLLGDQAKDFWAKKPSVWQVKAIGDKLVPVMTALVGEPGESDDS